ncbi:hypothetical protein AB0O76_05030 [Streptomyces sp. NPDC086554]|uniref:hypothetical protein n=1 Tax=Streptomyces sp. NPDC086554 TaxID=3154864 RepID=UPI00343520E1
MGTSGRPLPSGSTASWSVTLMRGRAFEEENLRCCERVLEILARREASPYPAAYTSST